MSWPARLLVAGGLVGVGAFGLFYVDIPPGIRSAKAGVSHDGLGSLGVPDAVTLDLRIGKFQESLTAFGREGQPSPEKALAPPSLAPETFAAVSPQAVEAAASVKKADPDEILEFGPMRVRRWVAETVVKAARENGADPVLLMAIADKESSFVPSAKAKTSSADGLFQFITSTWLRTVRDFGAKHGLAAEAAEVVVSETGEVDVPDAARKLAILELRRDAYVSAVMAAEMLNRDAARIAAKIGRPLTVGEIYIAHFLGPDDAETFLSTLVGKPAAAASALLPAPARANRPIFYVKGRRKARSLTVAEVHRKFEDMMGVRTARYRSFPSSGALPFVPVERRGRLRGGEVKVVSRS